MMRSREIVQKGQTGRLDMTVYPAAETGFVSPKGRNVAALRGDTTV
jgi:hypothetical protein